MSEQQQLVKHIDIDYSDVSASAPLLPKQTLRVKVGDSGVATTDKGLKRMVIPLTLEEPGVDQKGKPVQVGFKVTRSYLLDTSGKWNKERGIQELLRDKMAILGITDEEVAKATPDNFEDWFGKEVYATFDVKGDNQNVTRLKPLQS